MVQEAEAGRKLVEAVAVLVKVGAQLAAAQGAGAEAGELVKGGAQLAAAKVSADGGVKVGAQLAAAKGAGADGSVLVKVGARAEGRVLLKVGVQLAAGVVKALGALAGAPVQLLPSVASMAPAALEHKQIPRLVGHHLLVQPRVRAHQPRVRAHQPGPSAGLVLPMHLCDPCVFVSEQHYLLSSA